MLNINTNLSSLIAQRSFKNSSILLNQAMESLTSGYKINHASDNAANYSITTAMSVKLSSYYVAEDNVKMGLDLVNTATSSLNLITEQLQRIRELVVQAENGTYGEKSLSAINAEINSRVDELERIYATSEYNGVKFGGKEEETKFIDDINRRDTSAMETFASVKDSEVLSSGTYSITTAAELAKLALMTNNALISSDVEFVLGADIDLKDYDNWTPIGIASAKFSGKFDGNGYVISNLSINTAGNQIGLFGRTSKAEIKNLGLESVNIVMTGATDANRHAGGMVGYLDDNSVLINCYVTGKVDGCSQAKIIGGLVGQVYNNCLVESCYSECNVINVNTMGGNLLGCLEKESVLKNSFSSGNSTGKSNIAGLVGVMLNLARVENCYCTGDVNGNQSAGLTGSMHTNSSIINSWTSSKVKALSGTTTAGAAYSAAGSLLKDVYVLDENNKHAGIFVAIYRSSGTGNVVIEDCYYSDYYDNYSIPISGTNKTQFNNVKAYAGDKPFLYDTSSNIYTLYPEVNLQIGINADELSTLKMQAGFLLKGLKTLRGIGVEEGDYINYLDSLLSELRKKQTDYGALQNRLEYTLDDISIKYENLVSSCSTLRDADIAKVSSKYIQQQILQQASATLLATANQTPSIALQLI